LSKHSPRVNSRPDEAATVLQALASQVRIIEADEIEKRIAALEQSAAKGALSA